MSDYIDRQAAIEALRRAEALTRAFGYHNVIDTIRELPSVQPERKRGKWIKLYTGNYKCSECGDWWGNDDNNMIENFHYCPNCGAEMRG